MTVPVRPRFYEGQVLAADDLTTTVEQPRAVMARHQRLLHDWGITEGLDLVEEARTDPDTGQAYVQVAIARGALTDGTGREVVVPETVPLQEAQFQQVNGADSPTEQLYPVFLAGRDQEPLTASIIPSGCGGAGQSARVEEAYQVIFGRLGDERRIDDQVAPAIDVGPGDGTEPWRVLVGFVRWRSGHFVKAEPANGTIGRRYAGVRADTVSARSGRLTLRTDPAVTQGRPALVLDGEGSLTFGRLKGDGTVDRLVQVSPAGDLFVAGIVDVRGKADKVLVLSGIATDGLRVPLPDGVTEDQVSQGSVQVHVRVTPRLERPAALPVGDWSLGPVSCGVDDERRVRTEVRWLEYGGNSVRDLPAPVDFLVVVTVPGGSGPGGGSRP
jgi:hypothetical protein